MATRSRELKFIVTGDTRDAQRAFAKMDGATKNLESRMGKVTGALKNAGAVAAGAAVSGFFVAANAAIEAEQSQARLETQLKAMGTSYAAHKGQIDSVIQSTSRLAAVDDEDLQDALTNLVRATGDVDKSLGLLGVTADLARAKHIDLEKAATLVGKVAEGNTSALSRYGIQLEEGATASEALAELQDRFAGQAEAYGKTTAGSLDRIKIAAENVAEVAGSALAPHIEDAANAISGFISGMETGKGAGGEFADAMGHIADVLRPVVKFLGDHPALIAGAVAAWATYKTASLIALGSIRVRDFLRVFNRGLGAAATSGAAAGRSYAAAFRGAALAGTVGIGVVVAKRIDDAVAQALPGSTQTTNSRGVPTSGAYQPSPTGGRSPISLIGDILGIGDPFATASGLPPRDPGSRSDDAHKPRGTARDPKPNEGGTRGTANSPQAAGSGSMGLARFLIARFKLKFNSGYRSPQQNAAANGAANSWHMRGSLSNPGAIDLGGSMQNMQAALAWAKANVSGLAEAMIHDAGSGLHLHLAGPGVMNWRGGVAGGSTPTSGGGAISVPSFGGGFSSGAVRVDRTSSVLASQRTAAGRQDTRNQRRLERYRQSVADYRSLIEAEGENAIANAEASGNPDQMAAALFGNLANAQIRLETIDRLLKRNLKPGRRAALLSERSGLVRSITQWGSDLTAIVNPEAEPSALLQQQNQILQQQLDEARKANAIGQAQLQSLGTSYADTLSGQIGGRVGLGFQAAGVPGTLARY